MSFELKTQEQLAAMSAEQKQAYFADSQKASIAETGISKEDLSIYLNQKANYKMDEFEERRKELVSKNDLEALKTEVEALVSGVTRELREMGLEVNQAAAQKAAFELNNTHKSADQQIKEQIVGAMAMKDSQEAKPQKATILKGNSWNEVEADIVPLDADKGVVLKLTKSATRELLTGIKVVGDMSITGNVSGGLIPVEDRLEGLNIIPSRRVRLLALMEQRSTSANAVSWVYQANKEGAAGQTDEAATKNQIDFDLVVAQERISKYTAYIKASTEMLDDIEWMVSEIRAELERELLKSVEADAYEGTAAGSGINVTLRGLRTIASAFSAGASAGAVDSANIMDVINVAITHIKIVQEGNEDMSRMIIFMNPQDVLLLKQIKVSSTDRRYVDMLYMAGDEMRISGVPIVESTLVTQDEYLVADMSKALFVVRDGVTVQVGLDGNDFTENKRTFLAEWRGAVVVRNNDRTAFVAGDFTTDAAALETP